MVKAFDFFKLAEVALGSKRITEDLTDRRTNRKSVADLKGMAKLKINIRSIIGHNIALERYRRLEPVTA